MSALLPSVILITISTILYIVLIYNIDPYEKEPIGLVAAAFVWGATFASMLSILIQIVIDVALYALFEETTAEGISAIFFTPIVEELLKGLAPALLYAKYRREFENWLDGIVYGAMSGFGFAYVENILYLTGTTSLEEWLITFIMRVMIFGFMHGFWTALVGIGFGMARLTHPVSLKNLYISAGFIAAMVMHGVHNATMLMLDEADITPFIVAFLNYILIFIIIVVFRYAGRAYEQRILRTYLADEVPYTLSTQAYNALLSLEHHDDPVPLHPLFLQAAVKLAHRKQQAQEQGECTAQEELDRWRSILRDYSTLSR